MTVTSTSEAGRIILSDWSANGEYIAPGASSKAVIWELMLQSLTRDEVCVQDEAFVLSEKLARWFSKRRAASALAEAFDIGALRVLTLPLDVYPPRLQELADEGRMRARSIYIQERTVRGEDPFTPNAEQNEFAKLLDSILNSILKRQPAVLVPTGSRSDRPIFQMFAQQFLRVLTDSKYQRWLRSAFPRITSNMQSDFECFILHPALGIDRARTAGASVKVAETEVFTRALGYQIAKTYPRPSALAMERLMQTVFAHEFCIREVGTGRYSPVLRELPAAERADAEIDLGTQESFESLVFEPVISVPLQLPYPRPGFSKVIRTVRESEPGKNLRRLLSDPACTHEQRCDAWRGLADELASRVGVYRPYKNLTARVLLANWRSAATRAAIRGVVASGIYPGSTTGSLEDIANLGIRATIGSGLGIALDLATEAWDIYVYNRNMRIAVEEALTCRYTNA